MTMATFVHENFEKSIEEPPGFLFVVCDERNGRAPKQSKAVRKRHVMRTFRAARTDKAQSSAENRVEEQRKPAGLVSCLAQTSKSSDHRTPYQKSPTTPEQQQAFQTGDVISRALEPGSPYESVYDVSSACQWVFYESKGDGTVGFDVARYHFLEMQWHQAKMHEVHLCATAMYAYRRQAQMAGDTPVHQRLYLQQKGRLLTQIQRQVDRHGSAIDSGTLVAVAILAFTHLQDAEFQAAGTHISVLRAMKALERLREHEWLIIAWLDLRLALNLIQRPLFDLYVPSAYRGVPQWQVEHAARARSLASICSRQSPSCIEAGLGSVQSFHLFNKLFLLFLAWPELEATSDPPYGHIYELEYLIRFHHSQIVQSENGVNAISTELLLLAIQLNLWILCRFWTPIQHAARACVLDRGLKLFSDIPDILKSWRTESGSELSSLLWVVATFSACEQADRTTSVARPVLEATMEEMHIKEDAISRELEPWPWMRNCLSEHPGHLWKCSLNEDESLTIEVAPEAWCMDEATLPIRQQDRVPISAALPVS